MIPFKPWTKEEAALYDWRFHHKITLARLSYSGRVEIWVQYAVGRNWPSESVMLIQTGVENV